MTHVKNLYCCTFCLTDSEEGYETKTTQSVLAEIRIKHLTNSDSSKTVHCISWFTYPQTNNSVTTL